MEAKKKENQGPKQSIFLIYSNMGFFFAFRPIFTRGDERKMKMKDKARLHTRLRTR
jgi:hypothetical protein